jgi:hypothetical protein
MLTLKDLEDFDTWKNWKGSNTQILDSLQIFKFLESQGVYINYSVEHYQDGSNVCFSIDFIDGEKRTGTSWYNDNHSWDAAEAMEASIRLALWYLKKPERIALINGGYNNPAWIEYNQERHLFVESLIKTKTDE